MNDTVSKLVAFADYLSTRSFFRALQRGLALTLPLIMVGALTLLVRYPPVAGIQIVLEDLFGPNLNAVCDIVIAGTFGIASLVALFGFSGELTSHYNQIAGRLAVNPLITAVVVMSSFFIVIAPQDGVLPASVLSLSDGLLVALAVASLGGVLFLRLSRIRQLRMPLQGLNNDPVVGDVFSVMPAGMLTILVFAAVKAALIALDVTSASELLGRVLATPFQGAGDNLIFAVGYVAMTQLLWLFGAHGPNVLNAVQQDMLIPATIANNTAVATGQAPDFIFTSSFFDVFTRMGGSGSTLSLIIALIVFSRSGGAKKFALVAIAPALCNVNEPILLGIPLVLNPIYAIPFVLTPILQTVIAYAATLLEWMPKTSFNTMWTTPAMISGYAVTGSVAGSIVQFINIAVGVAAFAPFVMLADKRAHLNSRNVISRLLDIAENPEERAHSTRYVNLSGEHGRMALALANDLEAAFERPDQIFLEYQPQIDGKRNEISGVEALLRWKHPQYERIAPPITVALAEDIGMINKLGYHVLALACRQRMDWRAHIPDRVRMAVNVSPRQLQDGQFALEVISVLDETGLPPELLEIEITETSVLTPSDQVIETLEILHRLGIRIALDDFGMGHTSLYYLREFPIDTVKIDRSLTILDNGQVNEQIVQSIVDLSTKMQFDIVVEGIEEELQLQRFRNIGCEVFQGYLFSKPLSSGHCLDFMRDYRGDIHSAWFDSTLAA